jgi:hypothetical protein
MAHERHPSDNSVVGMRPSSPQPYPEMLYLVTGKNPWTFTTKVVTSDVEARLAEGQGFVSGGPARAADAYDARQQDLATAAAHRNHDDRGISAAARAEVDAAEQASSRHLGEIPAKPKPKRIRVRNRSKRTPVGPPAELPTI